MDKWYGVYYNGELWDIEASSLKDAKAWCKDFFYETILEDAEYGYKLSEEFPIVLITETDEGDRIEKEVDVFYIEGARTKPLYWEKI